LPAMAPKFPLVVTELTVTVPGANRPMLPPPVPLPVAEASMLETVRSEAAIIATEPPLAPNTPPGPELPRTVIAALAAALAPPDSIESRPELLALRALEVVIEPLTVTGPIRLKTATEPPSPSSARLDILPRLKPATLLAVILSEPALPAALSVTIKAGAAEAD